MNEFEEPSPVFTMARVLGTVGKASWQWDQELGAHIPVCSGWKMNGQRVVRCGNGPLDATDLPEGLCSEGPHLEPTSLPRNLAEALRERGRSDALRQRR